MASGAVPPHDLVVRGEALEIQFRDGGAPARVPLSRMRRRSRRRSEAYIKGAVAL